MTAPIKIKFQEKAEKELTSKVIDALLEEKTGREVLLQAPTGAGKTKMVSTSLLEISKKIVELGQLVTFVWIAPRSLHEQSFDRIKQFFKNSTLRCYLLDNSSELYFKENSICFFNWESLNKQSNILIKDTEQELGLSQKIKKTKAKSIKIVTIIDESHYSAGAAGAQKVLESISPDVIINISATPKESLQERVYIDRQDVIDSGLIRDAIVINPSSILKYSSEGQNLRIESDKEISPLALINEAITLQADLRKMYLAENSKVEPLILVQFPDSSSYGPDVNKLKNEILNHLEHKFNWVSGQEIAQWFNDVKLGLEPDKSGNNIVSFDSNVKILFFKQAIALGWDCPRAQILVEFREFKSETFKIQVLGRILRQPEHKSYSNPALNKGYVLTNNQSIAIKGETISLFNKRVSVISDKFKDISLTLPLPFSFNKNLDERNFLRQDIVQQLTSQLSLHKHNIVFSEVYSQELIQDYTVEDIDASASSSVPSATGKGILTGDTLSMAYDSFFKAQMLKLADMYQGRKYLKAGWESFFKSLFPAKIDQYLRGLLTKQPSDEQSTEVIRERGMKHLIRCSLFANKDIVEKCIQNSIDAHLSKYEPPKKREILESSSWTIPSYQEYSTNHEISPTANKNIYTFCAGLNSIEEKFAAFLDKSPRVKWWLKNRDSGKQNFAIRYTDENGVESLFYPDFLVQYVDGSWGIFDPKGWGREGTAMSKNTCAKINALFEYSRKLNKAGIKVVSGVIVEQADKLYAYLNNQENYPYPVVPSLAEKWILLTQ